MVTLLQCRHHSVCSTLAVVLFVIFTLFIQSAISSSSTIRKGKILVLGSDGMIGTALVNWLTSHDYPILHVKNRRHIDLRKPNSLSLYEDEDISFAFFLACEVGGSKYIDSAVGNIQLDIIENNLLIYQNVFPFLLRKRIPYIFTSSYLQSQPTSYGAVKRLGEAYISAIHLGKIVRLWNIYGPEKLGPRSHVLGDWIASCLASGFIHSMTDGREARQFLHVDDTANALGIIMENYEKIENITDLSSNQWTTMREVAQIISRNMPKNQTCQADFAEIRAVARARLSPKVHHVVFHEQLWKPAISLEDGISGLFRHYSHADSSVVDNASTSSAHTELLQHHPNRGATSASFSTTIASALEDATVKVIPAGESITRKEEFHADATMVVETQPPTYAHTLP